MIPTEIDELMWGIAESGDRQAVHQFELRHPTFKEELRNRLDSMDALKRAGRGARTDIPVFKPKAVRAIDSRPLFWVAGIAGIVLLTALGLGVASDRSGATPETVQPVDTRAAALPETMQPPPVENRKEEVSQQQVPTEKPQVDIPPPQQIYEPNTGKTDVKIASATLHAAIQLIASSGGLTVTIAPGLPNPSVQIDYKDLTALEMLKELGKDYAFTPVVDGEREILILPIKDDENPGKSDTNQTD